MKTSKKDCWLLWVLGSLVLLAINCTQTLAQEDTWLHSEATPTRITKWRDLKFGLMLHWGLYSVPGGVWNGTNIEGYDEQIKHLARIPSEEYDQLTNQFRADKFDPDFIARIAKEAGMRYVVITSKHHDGFNLWHSQLSPFNAVDATPFGKDAIKLLSDACDRHGMKFGVYYSLIDWHYPGATPMSDHNSDAITPALEEYTMGQLRELLTGYGPLAEIWFDMSKPTPEQSQKFAALTHALQPNCMVSGRIFNRQEDFQLCGDNEIPTTWIAGPWETAVTTFHETWGYRSWQVRDDLKGKIREKIRDVAFITARGGNYLLNIGPRGDGSIVEFEADMLRGIGQWMKANDEAIFGTDPEPWLRLDFGYATSRSGRLYLFVKDFPAEGVLRVPGWQAPLPKAHVLSEPAGNALACSLDSQTLTIKLPKEKEDPNLTVLAVDYKSSQPFLPADLVQLTSGQSFTLIATNGLPWQRLVGQDYYSQHPEIVAREWNLLTPETGDWLVVAHRATGGDTKGYLFSLGESAGQFILPASGSAVAQECGRVSLAGGKWVRLRLQAISPGGELADQNLALELRPASRKP